MAKIKLCEGSTVSPRNIFESMGIDNSHLGYQVDKFSNWVGRRYTTTANLDGKTVAVIDAKSMFEYLAESNWKDNTSKLKPATLTDINNVIFELSSYVPSNKHTLFERLKYAVYVLTGGEY